VTDTIFQKLGVNLHHRKDHPLGIIKEAIFQYFEQTEGEGAFKLFDDFYPVVTTTQNFDELLIPEDHISRPENDTYYVDSEKVLRCHTSAHQAELLREKHKNFLVIGDVYRRDTIDATHYPVFHQMEGVKIFEGGAETSVVEVRPEADAGGSGEAPLRRRRSPKDSERRLSWLGDPPPRRMHLPQSGDGGTIPLLPTHSLASVSWYFVGVVSKCSS